MKEATFIVRLLYSNFPEVDFINEENNEDGSISLIFDASEANRQMLEDFLSSEGLDFSIDEPYLTIIGADDEDLEEGLEEEDSKTLTEGIFDFDINTYQTSSPLRGANLRLYDRNSYSSFTGYEGQYIQNAVDQLKAKFPDADSWVNNISDDYIYHIYKAREKNGSLWWDKPGINIEAIKEPEKFVKYFTVACALPALGFIRKAYNSDWWATAQQLGIILYGTPILKAIKDRLPDIIKTQEEKEKKKADRKAAKEQAKLSSTTASAAASSPVKKGSFSGTWISDDNVKDVLLNSGIDIYCGNYDISADIGRRFGVGAPSALMTQEVTFNKGKASEWKTTLQIKNPDNTDLFVYSGDGFRNLPSRQFIAYVKRKIKQLEDEAQAQPVDDVEDVDTEEDINDVQEGLETSKLNEARREDLAVLPVYVAVKFYTSRENKAVYLVDRSGEDYEFYYLSGDKGLMVDTSFSLSGDELQELIDSREVRTNFFYLDHSRSYDVGSISFSNDFSLDKLDNALEVIKENRSKQSKSKFLRW